MKKTVCSILCLFTVVACVFSVPVSAASTEETVKYNAQQLIEITTSEDSYDYFLLKTAFKPAKETITLDMASAVKGDDLAAWKVNSSVDASFKIKVTYRVISDKITDSFCKILVNDKLQYTQLDGFILPKEYENDSSKGVITDIYGNELTPDQISVKTELENYVFDFAGVYSKPLTVNFNKGENNLCFEYPADEIELLSVKLLPAEDSVSYDDYIKARSEKKQYNGENLLVEAEDANYKSDTVLYPVSDKSSPKVSPVKSGTIFLNSIGGKNWKITNQYIKWVVDIPESGLYSISFKYKQNQNVGQQSRRALYINGEIPFNEAGDLVFDYSSKWRTITLGGKEEYLFYFEKGSNEIKLQSTLGKTDTVVRAVDNCVNELNAIYRKLLVVLGSEPDMSKDYKLDKNVPEVIEYMTEIADRLDSAAYIYKQFNSKKSSTVATLEALSRQLREMNKDSDKIPSEFSYFKTNIGSLGTNQASLKQQPLLLDYFALTAPDAKLPKTNGNFFENLFFSFKEFLFSFIIDYNSLGSLTEESKGETIKVWMASGRDQAQIIRNLVSDEFTPKTGHKVKVELVSAASLLPSTVAGIGPDIYIGVSSGNVVDYSMRNAAYDLTKFKDFEEFKNNFYDEAFIPLAYMGGIYALPTSMNFNVMYYRTDILEDLGLEVPETWQDVIAMSSVLSVNNMSFGLPSGNSTFLMMLRQKGLEVYSEDQTECLLDSSETIDVFSFYTNFYNNYGFPITYSLVNRFRTGETPIAVDSIAIYNNLEISAPEIKGLWDFTVVPGFKMEDGTVDHTSIVTPTATMILSGTKVADASWEFVKWWSSAEIQSEYGRELESRLGSSGRYTSANRQALEASCWNKKELTSLQNQLKSVSAIEQVPGGYYLTRNLDNAFRNAVYYDKKPMDVMFDYVYKINAELTDKRTELGLETAKK
ncbi:MAG: extracellular solute-binding protein [Clostridia bacterium]|nr:extracellular solute-binding protein [Clostridia bacterium]